MKIPDEDLLLITALYSDTGQKRGKKVQNNQNTKLILWMMINTLWINYDITSFFSLMKLFKIKDNNINTKETIT